MIVAHLMGNGLYRQFSTNARIYTRIYTGDLGTLLMAKFREDDIVEHPNSRRNDETQWYAPLYCRFEQLIDCVQPINTNSFGPPIYSNCSHRIQAKLHMHIMQIGRCAHKACCALCSGQTARKASSTCGGAFSLGAAELETSW